MNLFGTYDIRGTYPEQLNEENAYLLGRAFVTYLKCKKVLIGRDARLSSEKLLLSLVEGITDQGADVIDIGLCTTPMLYYAHATHGTRAAIMITASHLGREYNGLKMCKGKDEYISYHNGGKELENIFLKKSFKKAKKGTISRTDLFEEYKHFMLKNFKKTQLNVIVDAANMMGALDGKILSQICNVKPLFFTLDGSFPNHDVNPLFEENTRTLRKEVTKQKADLGIAFDGDSDRVVFIDEKGKAVYPDILLALLVTHTLHKGQAVVADVRSSKIVEETAKIQEAKAFPCPSGHTFFKETMKKNKALLGGEKSGHYYFKEFFYADCPLLTALKIITILDKNKKTLSQLIKPYLKYVNAEEKNFKVKDKKASLQKIEKEFSKGALKILKLDGLSIYHKDFWFNLRESQTEDLLRLNIEANNQKVMKKVQKKFKELLK